MNPVYLLCIVIFDIGWAALKVCRDACAVYTRVGSRPGAGPTHFYIAAATGMHAAYLEPGAGKVESKSISVLRLPHSAASMDVRDVTLVTCLPDASI